MATGDTLYKTLASDIYSAHWDIALFDMDNNRTQKSFNSMLNPVGCFFYMPPLFNDGDIEIDVYWHNPTAGDVVIAGGIKKLSLDADNSPITYATTTDTVPATTGHMKKTTITLTGTIQKNFVGPNDFCCVVIFFDWTNSAHTAGTNGRVMMLEVKEG